MRIVFACLVGLLVVSGAATAARAPTGVEKRSVMAEFNDRGRGTYWPVRCALVRMSTVDSRYAMVTARARTPPGCPSGNGFELYVRPSADSLTWRFVAKPCAPRLARIIRDVRVDCF